MSSEMVDLPSLRPLDESIVVAYPCEKRPNNSHMSQPSQFMGNAYNEKGIITTTQK
jgi:hypothetical protein